MMDDDMEHEIRHSIAIINRLSLSIAPIISRMAKYFLENKIKNIASEKHLKIVHESMSLIAQESDRLLHNFETISWSENKLE